MVAVQGKAKLRCIQYMETMIVEENTNHIFQVQERLRHKHADDSTEDDISIQVR